MPTETATINVNPTLPRKFTGRRVLYSSVDEINAENIVSVLSEAILAHNVNLGEIDYLLRYYKGDQPVWNRVKVAFPEIKNIVLINHAKEIVDFKMGYEFGDPIQYVRRARVTSDHSDELSDDAAKEVSKNISQINEYMASESKHGVDSNLAEWLFICGTSYRFILPDKMTSSDEDEAPFEIGSLDPRSTFVVYGTDLAQKPLMAVCIRVRDKKPLYCCYTKTHYYEVQEEKVTKVEGHDLGDIPIIEYPANTARLGAFEPVITQLDALNILESNRVDGVEQFVQAYLIFLGCDIDTEEFDELRRRGALALGAGDGQKNPDVKALKIELNQDQTQTLVDDIYQHALIVCGMPDRQGGSRSTGDTQQAVVLRDGWEAAESKAQMTENTFKISEKRFLKIALRLLEQSKKVKVKLSDIEIKFNRNRTDNLLIKVQALQGLLSAGVHPQVAFKQPNVFSDPEQVYLDSIPYLERNQDSREQKVVGDKAERTAQTHSTRENSQNTNVTRESR